MTLMPRSPWPGVAERALEIADELRARAHVAPPLGVTGLGARPRAAYDRLLDAVNRLPRPLMVLGSLALLASALVAPDWFAARMEALADMPEALWWIIGAVLSLHWGARTQHHAQAFRRETAAHAPPPKPAPSLPASPGTDAALTLDTLGPAPNPALDDWRASRP
jgi:hypothetical protein